MNDIESQTLWIGAFRYYCGRMTYAVTDFCDLLVKSWPSLPDNTQRVIRKELEDAFARERDDSLYTPLGADCDRKAWGQVRALWKDEK